MYSKLPEVGSPGRGRRGRLVAAGLVLAGIAAGAALPSEGEESTLRLEDLVVTGTRTPHRVGDSPVRTELLMAEEMRASGQCTLADTLEMLPGLRVENNCQNCGTSDILLLGLEGKYTSVLFDGVPLYSGLAAVYGIDQIPAAFISRIEVVKGGGSAAYGSGAVGGIVNIIGRNPERSGGFLEYRHDSVRGEPRTQVSGIVDHVSADGDRTLTAYAQSTRVEPVDLNRDGFSDLTKRDLRVYGLRVGQKIGAGLLRVDYSRTVEFRRGGNKFDQPDNLADISERIDTTRDAANLLWAATVDPDFDYQATAGFAFIDRETFYGGLFGRAVDEPLTAESSPGAGDNDQPFMDRGYSTHGQVARDQFGFTRNWLYHADVQVNYRRGGHHLSAGGQYYREKIEDVVPVSDFVNDYPVRADIAAGDNVGVFVQDDWHPAADWEVVAGVRADRHSELAEPILSPRLNVKWTPSGQLTLRATYAAGFRAPHPFDEDLHIELIAGERARTVQAADLREERSFSTLLSAAWNPAFAEGKMSIEATGFYTGLDGTFTHTAIQRDPVAGDNVRLRYNGPDAEVGGVELNLGALPRPNVRLDFGYVMQFARYKSPVVLFDDGAGAVVTERDFLETPRHYAVVQAAYTRPEAGSVALSAVYTGPMKDINLRTGSLNERTPHFVVWNATVSRSFRWSERSEITLMLGVKNLFDSRQRDLETGVDRDPYYLYGPRTPRTVFASGALEW